MSTFSVEVVRVSIEPHPDADQLEIARVGGFLSLVKKGQFNDGDLAAYLPQDSVLPEWLLKQLGFWDDMNGKGVLHGSKGNRIRPKRLRGIFSEGVLMKPVSQWALEHPESGDNILFGRFTSESEMISIQAGEGDDISTALGVTKYEMEVPTHMAGNAAGGDLDATFSYDFENIKKNPGMFTPDDDVVITEKIHGTLLQIGLIPQAIWEGKKWADKCPFIGDSGKVKGIVTSKGLGGKGIMLDPADEGNLYVKMVKDLDLWNKMLSMPGLEAAITKEDERGSTFMFGEIFGKGVQDLGYGADKPTFRVFDICVGNRNKNLFVDHADLVEVCDLAGLDMVPVLYEGKYDPSVLADLTAGNTTLTTEKQIREGVVIRTSTHEVDRMGRRKVAKSINEKYLTRKSGTEFQ